MKLEDMMLSETREKDEYWVIYAEPKKKKWNSWQRTLIGGCGGWWVDAGQRSQQKQVSAQQKQKPSTVEGGTDGKASGPSDLKSWGRGPGTRGGGVAGLFARLHWSPLPWQPLPLAPSTASSHFYKQVALVALFSEPHLVSMLSGHLG